MADTVFLNVPETASAPALVLRPWRAEDVPALVEAHRDPELRHRLGAVVEDGAGAERWVEEQRRGWETGTRFGFAVLAAGPEAAPGGPEACEGPLWGNAVLKLPGGPTGEVGYWTAAPARGRGVAPRALEALTTWAFGGSGPTGLDRLELLHQVDNPASCRVAEKSGYALAGILPAAPPAFPRDGHLHARSRRA
ncbi:RimJ/RimL family protein N-acetyltransferase [Streptomyces filamentosus]